MGEGLVPTAPLINMYLGLLCSKVMGGEAGGGVVCTVLCCWVPAGPRAGCGTPVHRDEQTQSNFPVSLVGPTPPAAMLRGRCSCGHTAIQTLEPATHKPTPADTEIGSKVCTKTASRATELWGAESPEPAPSLLPTPTLMPMQKNNFFFKKRNTQECVASYNTKGPYALKHTRLRTHHDIKVPRVQ